MKDVYIEEARKLFNHICINGSGHVVRIVGFHEDESDYYWITRDLFGTQVYSSCVGGYESLKGKIEFYDDVERVFTVNGCPPAESFIETSEV